MILIDLFFQFHDYTAGSNTRKQNSQCMNNFVQNMNGN